MKTELVIPNETYGKLICNYFQKEFPLTFNKTKSDILEILTEILIGTKETRYGPSPSPEILVNIRKVLKEAIELDNPIPILIAWGGRKAIAGAKIDIAELVAIKQLITLDQKIRQFYSPGINANIRIEDTGAYLLYREQGVGNEIAKYSTDFTKLVNILRGTSRLTPIMESSLMNTEDYIERSLNLSVFLKEYITETDAYPGMLGKGKTFGILNDLGWKGVIPFEQRDFYRSRYRALYPDVEDVVSTKYLSDYLAGAKVRYDMNGRAEPAKNFIGISFVQPVPGAPESMFSSTLYYRTLPLSEAKTHMPAWRSKGYLKISNNNEVKAKITSFSNEEVTKNLQCNTVKIISGGASVEVQADYLLT